jgi:glycosyltransferase involved in cell wall biosynthesis
VKLAYPYDTPLSARQAIAPQLGVCHVASGDRWAGAEVQLTTLLRELSGDATLVISAILLNEGRLSCELRRLGIAVTVIPEREHSFTSILQRATRSLLPRPVQILHSHRYKENLLCALLARRCGVSYIVRTQHGRPEPASTQALKQWLVYVMDRFLNRHAVDRVISVSSDLTAYLEGHIAPERIVVIPNGLELEQVHSAFTVETAKLRLNIAADAPVIGTACRLAPIKRLDLFLSVVLQVARRLPESRFVIAGDGPERESLRRRIVGTSLEGRLLLLGHRDDIYDVLRAMDLMLITSDHEGLPMVVLEAMALGTPVVSRAIGGIAELIQNGSTGSLLASADPESVAATCVALLKNRPRRERLAREARQFVACHYSAAANAAKVRELYRSLANV